MCFIFKVMGRQILGLTSRCKKIINEELKIYIRIVGTTQTRVKWIDR